MHVEMYLGAGKAPRGQCEVRFGEFRLDPMFTGVNSKVSGESGT